MARLIVKTDGGTETIDLTPSKPISVGRDESNQIALPDVPGVSRTHCRVTAVQAGGGLAYEVSDMGATNKTRVNGKPTDRRVLSHGDVIAIGKAEITFEDEREEQRLRDAGQKGLCYLEWASGERKGEKVWLDAPRTTLGRRPSNAIVLDDRMSSGHHAEVARDLNGYTVRDMGSTNGTLINGEPLTEAPLTHGSRIRIGNSRFVFKDPSMKDVEVELAQFDEDEGWGMMGDIDLSRARGSYAGLLLGLLLLAGAAAGGWFLMQQADAPQGPGGGEGGGNLVQNGKMDDEEAIAFLWDAQSEDDPVTIKAIQRGADSALSIRHTGGQERPGPVVVSYTEEFPALASEPLRVRASLRATGDATLVAVWRNKADASSGATALTHTIALGSGRVDALAVKPPWADRVSIGVRLGADASATLDDVEVTRESGAGLAARELACPGDPKAWIHPSGGLDLINSLTVLIAGMHPIARMPDGTVLSTFSADEAPTGGEEAVEVRGTLSSGEVSAPASISWGAAESGDGLLATITCEGAQAVGLDAHVLRAHVGDGINVLTAQGPRSISAGAGEGVGEVQKTLSGDPKSTGGRPRTLVTIAPQGEAAGNALELLDAADEAALLLRHWSAGSSARFIVVTDFEVQSRAAQDALDAAETEVRQRPGSGIRMLREVAVLYPFNERVRNRAVQVAEESERAAREEIGAFSQALAAFRIFRSADTLAALDGQSRALSAKYPAGGTGPLETAVHELRAEADEALALYYSEHAGAELSRLEKLGDLLADLEGYKPMAAIFYRTIVDRFGHLEGEDSFGRRVARARTRFEQLMSEEGVAAAVPTPK